MSFVHGYMITRTLSFHAGGKALTFRNNAISFNTVTEYGLTEEKALVKKHSPFCPFLQTASIVTEDTVTVDSMEAVEGALNDSWDQLDTGKPAFR